MFFVSFFDFAVQNSVNMIMKCVVKNSQIAMFVRLFANKISGLLLWRTMKYLKHLVYNSQKNKKKNRTKVL